MTALVVERFIAAGHPAFDGHFAGRPVLPGVVLLSEVLQAIQSVPQMAAAIGDAPLLVAAKFVAPVRGACCLRIALRLDAGALAFEVGVDATLVATGHYQVQPQAAPAERASTQ